MPHIFLILGLLLVQNAFLLSFVAVPFLLMRVVLF